MDKKNPNLERLWSIIPKRYKMKNRDIVLLRQSMVMCMTALRFIEKLGLMREFNILYKKTLGEL